MKLLRLEVENFGVFSERRFDFERGFHLIYGANEAGKTTLLQLIRETLFGFPHKNPYALHGDMAVTAHLELANGTRLHFRRRKGKVDRVLGQVEETGANIDEAVLERLLGNANSGLYGNVFGFSLNELQLGEASLQHANLTEALFGGGLGNLANFRRVQQTLDDQQKKLFSPRGKNPLINRLLQTLGEQSLQLRNEQVRPSEYEQLCQSLAEAERTSDRLKRDRDALQQRLDALDRLAAAAQRWPALQAAREERARLAVPADFPRDGAQLCRHAREQLTEAESAGERLQRDLRSLAADDAAQQPVPELLAAEAQLRELHQHVGRVRRFRADLPVRQHEATTIRADAVKRLTQLDPSWSLDDLPRFATGLAQGEALQALAEEQAELSRRRATLDAKIAQLGQEQQRCRDRLAQFEAVPPAPALEQLVARAARYEADAEALTDIEREVAGLLAQQDGLVRKLQARLPANDSRGAETTAAEWARLPVPPVDAVTAARDRLAQRVQAVRQAEDAVQAASDELARLHQQRGPIDGSQPVPDRTELARERESRDAVWSEIRAVMEAGVWSVSQAQLADFEARLVACDKMSDLRFAHADIVARRDQLVEAITRQQAKIEQTIGQQHEARSALLAEQRTWRELWSACRIEPLAPERMLDWLHDQAALVRVRHDAETRQARLADLRRRTTEFVSELQAALGPGDAPDATSPDGSRRAAFGATGSALLAEARQRVNAARDAASGRQHVTEQLPRIVEQLTAAEHERESVRLRQEDWSERWRAQLAAAGFPADWTPQQALRVHAGLADVRTKLSDAATLDGRIADMRRELEEFERDAATVVPARVLPSSAAGSANVVAEDTVIALHERLDESRQRASRRESLARQRADLARQIEEQESKATRLRQQLASLFAAAGVATADEFLAAASRAARGDELAATIRRLEGEIDALNGSGEPDAFRAAVAAAQPDDLSAERQELQTRLRAVEAEYQRAVERAGVTRAQQETLFSDSRCTERALQLESTRAQLGDALERYAPLVLASGLLTQALEQFEHQHQPRLLQEATRLFAKMTAGRYVEIQRKIDREEKWLVRQPDGTQKEPEQLSSGTREQLYLAIRLAYITHFSRTAEPLPLVMDDVLVNFDATRVKHTLEALLDFAGQVQILFLTCHRHVVEIVRQLDPTAAHITSLADEPPELAPSAPFVPPPPPHDRPKPPPRKRPAVVATEAQGLLFSR